MAAVAPSALSLSLPFARGGMSGRAGGAFASGVPSHRAASVSLEAASAAAAAAIDEQEAAEERSLAAQAEEQERRRLQLEARDR